MTANVMELNLNELVAVTGAMTREEREDALRARDDDGFFETTVKDIARPFVKGIDGPVFFTPSFLHRFSILLKRIVKA